MESPFVWGPSPPRPFPLSAAGDAEDANSGTTRRSRMGFGHSAYGCVAPAEVVERAIPEGRSLVVGVPRLSGAWFDARGFGDESVPDRCDRGDLPVDGAGGRGRAGPGLVRGVPSDDDRLAAVPIRRPARRRQPVRDDDRQEERSNALARRGRRSSATSSTSRRRWSWTASCTSAPTDGSLWAYPAAGCGQSFCDTPLWHSTTSPRSSTRRPWRTASCTSGRRRRSTRTTASSTSSLRTGAAQSVCTPLWQGLAGPESILMSSPTVAGGVVYVGSFGHKLFAFDASGCGAKKCQPLWTAATGGSIESTPTVSDGVVYVGSDDGKLYAFDAAGCGAETCKPLWTGDLVARPAPCSSPRPPSRTGTCTWARSTMWPPSTLPGAARRSAHPIWQAPNDTEFYGGSPACHAHARVHRPGDRASRSTPRTGAGRHLRPPVDAVRVGFQAAVVSSPTVANGVVYAGRNTGEVLAWKPGGAARPSATRSGGVHGRPDRHLVPDRGERHAVHRQRRRLFSQRTSRAGSTCGSSPSRQREGIGVRAEKGATSAGAYSR